MAHYPHLLSPGRIGTLELKNRLFQTAMGTNLAHHDGTISEESIAFYAARAAGGAALVTMGAVGVAYPRGQVQAGQVGISDDRFLPGLKRMTDAIHRNGGRISAQLHHGGTSAVCDMAAGRPIPVPSMPQPQASSGKSVKDSMFPEEKALSPLPHSFPPIVFKEMDDGDIADLIENFADAATRAVEAGFDAIELHAAHTYLLHSFISPAENRRTDKYGGSAENRARLMKEVIEAIRARVGRAFPVLCKLNAAEFFIDGGITLDDVRITARIAEAAGADAITVSAQHNYGVPRALFSSYLPQEPGKLIPLAAAVREAVSIPVVTVGRIDPDVADRAIAEGKFDFMAMGRKQIADDQFTNHLAKGGAKAVRPCIYCYACLSQAMLHLPLRCAVNADVGYEKDMLAPAEISRRVVVVGGGPGGMEAARRLTLRGHRVTLLEAAGQLGGTARVAAIAYAPNGDFVDWLKAQLAELGVDVRLNMRATLEAIRALEPEAVVVATGAIRRAPPIEGKDLPHVHDGASLRALLLGEDDNGEASKAPLSQRLAMGAARTLGLTNSPDLVRKASKLWMPVGDRVVIIGGDLVGLELAEFLHERGRHVTVVDEPKQFGRGLSPARRSVMLDELPMAGVVLHSGASAIRIGETAVSFTSADGVACEAPADTVIIAKGAEANTGLYDELVAAGLDAHMVGDCADVGYIIGAVRTAADVAAKI
ncbi:FAD-dependent oxidoreductase [Phenylobacterium sp. LjRoot219]|uniref:oxidoreductase n=1 Tax=Phenylobacterium sp. LjRoot219 TaxID=3342283 RepID=UPI003ED07341